MNFPPAPWEIEDASHSIDPALSSIASSLSDQRRLREVNYRLRTALREADSDYSCFRVEGLKKLLSSLDVFSSSEEWIRAFIESQKNERFQIFPVLMNKSILLFRQTSEPFEIDDGLLRYSSPLDEAILAVRVLNCCFLIDPLSRRLSTDSNFTEVLIEKISEFDNNEEMCGICLDCLISTFLQNPNSIKKFCDSNHFNLILKCIQNKEIAYSIRLKFVEFLQLFLDQILPSVKLEDDWSKRFLQSFFEKLLLFLGSDAVALLKTKNSNLDEIPAYGRLKTRAQHVIQSIK